MKPGKLYSFLIFFLFAECLHAQRIQPMPSTVLTKDESAIRTTLYVPDSNQLMFFQQNKCWLFTKDGKQIREPIIIREEGQELWYPHISGSGKMIAFYLPDYIMHADNNKMALYNRDSGYIVGTYKAPVLNELDRIRFSGDSLLQYYTHIDEYKDTYIWNIIRGDVRTLSMREDTLQRGVYDITYYKNKVAGIYREADSLGFIITDVNNNRQFFDAFKLKNAAVKTVVQFSQGYPYALVGDEGTGQTRIFKLMDTSFVLIATLDQLPVIYAVAGTEENCYLLYADTTQKGNPVIKFFDVRANREFIIPGLSGTATGYIYNIYPGQNLFTVSHPTNGHIIAFSLTDAKKSWEAAPQPAAAAISNTIKTDSSDNKLFKVLIKQGSDNITKSYYDKEGNLLYLIKNDDKLITVDADAKCATRWEQFYKDNHVLSYFELMPGSRYIFYEEQQWKRGIKGMTDDIVDDDGDKYNHLYPYSNKVFDRQTSKTIFNLQSQHALRTDIINDSLLSWSDESYLAAEDSITVYNLNTGISKNVRPQMGAVIENYKLTAIGNKLYFLIATKEKLIMINESGKKIFSRSFPGEKYFLGNASFVNNAPWLYYNDDKKNTGNQVYKIQPDTVLTVRNLPPAIEVLTSKATNSSCWFMYKKQYKRKSGTIFHYRLFNAATGQDKLIDSSDNDYSLSANFELFPEENFYTINDRKSITWHDLNNGIEFKNFGRDEPTIISIAYSPDGRYLAAANPLGKVMLWDLGTGKETKSLAVGTGGYITKLAFSGDGRYLAASSGDIWETATGKNVVSVTDGSIWAVNSIDFSIDGKRIISGGVCIISWDAADGSKLVFQQRPGKKDMDTTGMCWNPNGCINDNYGFMVHSTAFHPNSRDFVTGNKSGIVQKWNTEGRKQLAYAFLGEINGPSDLNVVDLKYTRDGNHIIAIQQKCIYRLDGNTLKVEDSLFMPEGEEILGIDMDYDGKLFGCITSREKGRIIQIRSIDNLKVRQEFYTDGASFNKISFSPNKKQAATASDDGFCTIWDLATGKPAMYLSTIGDYGNIMVTPDNYYMASKSALDGVSFFKDSSFFSFDQFDLYLNRPDIVLSRLGYASPELINFYRNAYYKRLKKATGTMNDITPNDYVPLLKLTNKKSLPLVTSAGLAGLTFEVTDSSAQKGRISIFINGNLIKEHRFTEGGLASLNYADTVVLNQGINNIEAVYTSGSSVESRKEKIALTYSPAKPVQPKCWFIGVGISRYKDADMNLKYPVKDIKDIAGNFKKRYPALIIDTLLNEKATKENILALHDKLMKTSVNDKVIVSFSGHGLLSDSLDWYFATWDIDFRKPETRGLAYSMMEGILNGIPARQKLLLMDACHSGEVDKESDITFANKETAMEQNVVTTPRGIIVKGESKAGLQTSFEMMQDLFANLNNGNGTTVLSAAGGKEYALESDKWKNGVFTYSLLKALNDPATDKNSNKKISVKELKEAVFNMVKTLTGGRQKPTSRVEVLDDWDIW